MPGELSCHDQGAVTCQINNEKRQNVLQLPPASSGSDGKQLELRGITDLLWCWGGGEPYASFEELLKHWLRNRGWGVDYWMSTGSCSMLIIRNYHHRSCIHRSQHYTAV